MKDSRWSFSLVRGARGSGRSPRAARLVRDQREEREERERRRGRAWRIGVVVTATIGAIAACDTSPPDAPKTGDRVVNDAPPQQKPPAAPQDPDDGGATPYRDGGGDAAEALAICDTCKCAASQGQYCFGGATGETYRGTCLPDAGTTEDGGPIEDAAAPSRGVGCVAIPAACAKKPDCACILDALDALPCYPVCRDTKEGFEVYCPTP